MSRASKTHDWRGNPILDASRAASLSPYLSQLINETRADEDRIKPAMLQLWVVGFLISAACFMRQGVAPGVFVITTTILIVLAMLLLQSTVACPGYVRQRLFRRSPFPRIVSTRQYRQVLSLEDATDVANRYQRIGDDGGRVICLSKAVQWRVRACEFLPQTAEEDSDDAGAAGGTADSLPKEFGLRDVATIRKLAESCLALAYAIAVRLETHPRMARPSVVSLCLQVANDALERIGEAIRGKEVVSDDVQCSKDLIDLSQFCCSACTYVATIRSRAGAQITHTQIEEQSLQVAREAVERAEEILDLTNTAVDEETRNELAKAKNDISRFSLKVLSRTR